MPLRLDDHSLSGKLLIAMPGMRDPRFARSVIFLCAHNPEGAMGLVLNKIAGSIGFKELMKQLGIETDGLAEHRLVHFGGPVEPSRGFVLHTTDRMEESSMAVDDDIALTSTTDILKAIAIGAGPSRAMLALGCASWGPGQLDSELQQNAWLHAEADVELVFDRDLDAKWERAIAKIGIRLEMLSAEAGHA
ncbi:MAG: YqgE/AlgH family protein [Alphaproteobacteria bacterium]|nr:YqgE/AlgH family protein [Alphaproteobacteria bacterium]TAD91154.1 MAG: YqgE/AlgH family protein [Alphaproteobacteria bacterium]